MKRIIRALILLLSITLFVIACSNPWAKEDKLAIVTIALPGNPAARWASQIAPPDDIAWLKITEYKVTLKCSDNTTKTLTMPGGGRRVSTTVPAGDLTVTISVTVFGCEFASGTATANVIAGSNNQIITVPLDRKNPGIVMGMVLGDNLGTVAGGSTFRYQALFIWNNSDTVVSTSLTVSVPGIGNKLYLSTTLPVVFPTTALNYTGMAADEVIIVDIETDTTLTVGTYTETIAVSGAAADTFDISIKVHPLTRAGLQNAINDTAIGSEIRLPSGTTLSMDGTINIDKHITVRTINAGAGPILLRAAAYLGSFFNIVSGGLLRLGDTEYTVPLYLDGNGDGTSSLITVASGGRLELHDHAFLQNNSSYGSINNIAAGGAVNVSGDFLMRNGDINNCNAVLGGAVYVNNGGSFTISGGTIQGNYGRDFGGGVYINNGGSFNRTGGTIYGVPSNTAASAAPGKGHAVYYNGSPTHFRDVNIIATPPSDNLSTGDTTTNWDM